MISKLLEFYKNEGFTSFKNFGKTHWAIKGSSHLPGLCDGCHSTVDLMESVGYPRLTKIYKQITAQELIGGGK